MENFINNAPFIVVLLCLIVGFVFLVKGADLFVEGSSNVAKRFKVPSLIIGLTIVAMGTSLPETAVSVAASIAHNNTLAVSNVTGSNIFCITGYSGYDPEVDIQNGLTPNVDYNRYPRSHSYLLGLNLSF